MTKTLKSSLIAIAMFIATAVLVGCGEKDNADDNTTPADTAAATDSTAYAIAGTYSGLLTMQLQEMPDFELPSFVETQITLEAQTPTTVAVQLPDVPYDLNGNTVTIPAVKVEGIAVERTGDDSYTLRQTPINQTVNDKSYTGLIEGTVEDGILRLTFTAKYGNMPMTLIFSYTTEATQPEPEPEPEPEATLASMVQGLYLGNLNITIPSIPLFKQDMENMQYFVTATADDTISILVPEVPYTTTLPSVTLVNIPLQQNNDGTITLVHTEVEFTTANDKKWKGYVEGSVEGDALTLEYTVQYGNMPMSMLFHFQSTEKAVEEILE